jgi:hypothetical protein
MRNSFNTGLDACFFFKSVGLVTRYFESVGLVFMYFKFVGLITIGILNP